MLPRPYSRTPEAPSSPPHPPRCPYHPTFLSRSALADVLAVSKVAERLVLFFSGLVHQLEVTKDEGEAIHFAISGVAPPPPPVRPTTLWHLGNTAPAWCSPKCRRAGAWFICCPCDCIVCPLCNCAGLPTSSTNL